MYMKTLKKEGLMNTVTAYEKQETVLREFPEEECVTVGGDFEGHIGKRGDGCEEHGGQGYGEKNEDRSRILEMAQSMEMFCVHTGFTKKDKHLIIYKSGGMLS